MRYWSIGVVARWIISGVSTLHYSNTPALRCLVSRVQLSNHTRRGGSRLHVSVAGTEHGGKPGRFFLAPATRARLFKMPLAAYRLQCPFAIDFFLHPPQGFLYWLALFKLNFDQNYFTSSPKTLRGAHGLHGRCSGLVRTQRVSCPTQLSNGESGAGASETPGRIVPMGSDNSGRFWNRKPRVVVEEDGVK
jgi:hypothetical protein